MKRANIFLVNMNFGGGGPENFKMQSLYDYK